MMPIDCTGPSDVAIYLLTNLHEPVVPERVLFQGQTWQLYLVYRWDFHHLNLYRNTDNTFFAFHAGCRWTDREPPNMGIHVSIGKLVDSVSDFMWNIWAKKRKRLEKNRSCLL